MLYERQLRHEVRRLVAAVQGGDESPHSKRRAFQKLSALHCAASRRARTSERAAVGAFGAADLAPECGRAITQ